MTRLATKAVRPPVTRPAAKAVRPGSATWDLMAKPASGGRPARCTFLATRSPGSAALEQLLDGRHGRTGIGLRPRLARADGGSQP